MQTFLLRLMYSTTPYPGCARSSPLSGALIDQLDFHAVVQNDSSRTCARDVEVVSPPQRSRAARKCHLGTALSVLRSLERRYGHAAPEFH